MFNFITPQPYKGKLLPKRQVYVNANESNESLPILICCVINVSLQHADSHLLNRDTIMIMLPQTKTSPQICMGTVAFHLKFIMRV